MTSDAGPPHGDPTGAAALGSDAAAHADDAGHQPQSDYYDSEGNSAGSGADSGDDEGPEPSEQ
jgi:hypothetical protein